MAQFQGTNVTKKEADTTIQYKNLTKSLQRHVEGDSSSNMAD